LAGTWRKKCLRVPSGSGVALTTSTAAQGVRGEPVAAPQDSGLVLGHTGGAAERDVTFRRHDLDHAAADLDVDLLVDRSERDPVPMFYDPAGHLHPAPGPDRPAVGITQCRTAGVMQPVARVTAHEVRSLREPAGVLVRL
jgi:hypothetical protein